MLAAARPLPSDETTPPVMKMYLVVGLSDLVMDFSARGGGRQQPTHLFQVLRRIDAERFIQRFHRFDADAVLQRAQLLERFRPLERRRVERRQDEQGATAIRVKTDMSIERRPAAPWIA